MTIRCVLAISAASLCAIALSTEGVAQDEPLGFFITSVGPGNGGDVGGLDGADAHCQALAQAVGAGDRTWRAYLSTQASGGQPAVNARDRIGEGPWFNAAGLQIAANVDDLQYNNSNVNYEHALNEPGERVNSGASGDSRTCTTSSLGHSSTEPRSQAGRTGPVATGRVAGKEARWWATTTGSPFRLPARRGTSLTRAAACS